MEMEELARVLHHREQTLDAREARLIRADARRREDAHSLWRLRLQLESWQTKLTALEMRWHTQREQLEASLQSRTTTVARREAAAEATRAQWGQARFADHARLRAELERWVADRAALAKAAADFEEQHATLVAEVAVYAARALAAEQLVGEAMQDAGSNRAARRLAVLRRRWERIFDQKVKALDARRAQAVAEREAIEQRFRELPRLLADATSVDASPDNRVLPGSTPHEIPSALSEELVALRAEVERLAASVLEMEFPGEPESAELEPNSAHTRPFEPGTKAA